MKKKDYKSYMGKSTGPPTHFTGGGWLMEMLCGTQFFVLMLMSEESSSSAASGSFLFI